MRRHFINTFALIVLCVVFLLSGFVVINKKSVVNNNKKGHGEEYVGNYVSSTKSSASRKKFTTPRKKHVTKSLNELPPMDHLNAHALFLNTIPKSGAEVLVLLLKWLQGRNSFKHVKLKKENNNKLTIIQQENLIYEVEDTLRNEAIPVSFDKEVRFVNFSLIGKQSPTFFTLIRNPEELITARYPNLTDDYIKNCSTNDPGCLFNSNDNGIELNIPYFCGYSPRCDSLNDDWALAVAKENVEKYYPVVGVLDEIYSTITCLELKLHYFFRGATMMYKKKLLGFNKKKKTSKNTKKGDYKHLKKILRAEIAFYEWIKFRLFKDINNKRLF
ncbi:uronyl 2-sulfotransferase [Agrilus planipennis]|uniref:Uronyl 2-sulfotransferase n=1 Tax=Agrilus planipennis TaxID=224129 RepID=A0A1W4WV94_AGRPL|nr:uronyl 2-sulfotransferase [Agrilus planipennis]